MQVESDAAAALSALADRSFHLMVSDIVMAGEMDGVALAREARQRHPDLPIVLVTGYSTTSTANIGFPVLRKPFQLADLSRAVASVAPGSRGNPGNLVQLSDVRKGVRPDRG